MANYATKTDLFNVYGEVNITKWADLDNDRNPQTVLNRVNWALLQATEWVNSRLMNGHYALPFACAPKLIVLITAMQAGLLLYDARQIVSADGKDPMSRQRKTLDRYIRQIHSGQLKLLDAVSGAALDTLAAQTPTIAVDEEEII